LILGFAISAFAMATSIIPLSLLINDYSTQSKTQGPVKQYPGARSLTEGAEFDSSLSFIPQIALAKHDRPVANLQGCQILHGTKPKTCEFGKKNGAKTLVSIGDSHAAVMSEALKIFAEKNDWTYIHMSKANCPFMDETVYNKDASKVEECEAWNNEALQLILELRPDFVLSAQSTKYLVSRSEARADSYELIVSGLERRWKTLQEYGIHVVPMRDFPTFKYNPVNCVAEGRADCDRPRSEVTLDREPATSAAIRVNTPVLDLTDGFCEADYCRAVVGNVFVWRDTAHPTATYMRTLAPYLEKKLKQIINRVDENKGIEEF
jgi:hypothetical protein